LLDCKKIVFPFCTSFYGVQRGAYYRMPSPKR